MKMSNYGHWNMSKYDHGINLDHSAGNAYNYVLNSSNPEVRWPMAQKCAT